MNDKKITNIHLKLTMGVGLLIFVFILLMTITKPQTASAYINANKVHAVYKSERGFGNDKADIYSFKEDYLTDDLKLKQKDKDFNETYRFMMTAFEAEARENPDLNKTIRSIEKLVTDPKLKYSYNETTDGGTFTLTVYSPREKEGYQLIVTI